MTKRRKNPILHFPTLGDPGYKARRIGKTQTKVKRKKLDKKRQYKERAKRLRPFFKDMFAAKTGFDLRSPGKWTPAQKARVTRYFRTMAPNITGDFEVKRYYIPENMAAAVEASLQERSLKGQTAAAFQVDPGERLDIKIKRGVATIKKHGMARVKLKFDITLFAKDMKKEVERVLSQTDAQVFQILTGAQGQNLVLSREDVMDEIVRLVEAYAPENIRPDQAQRPFTDWLNGLIAYEGEVKRTYSAVYKFVRGHKKVMAKKRIDHLDKLSAEAQNISVATLRRRRTVRKKKRAAKR